MSHNSPFLPTTSSLFFFFETAPSPETVLGHKTMPTHEQSLAPSAQGRSSCSVVRKQLTHIGSSAEKSFFTELYKATGPPGGFREPIHPICMHAKQRGIAQR